MPFHFDFSANQILWTLTFAAELVLLIVLLGRDRARRFPWFTVYIVATALLELVSRLLFGRMAPMITSTIFLAISSLAGIIGLVVVFEIGRNAFAGAPRRPWLVGAVLSLVLAVIVLALWGPWPAWKTLTGASLLAALRGLQMIADKTAVLDSLLGIELGIWVVLLGRRFHGGWRSHPQQISIGFFVDGVSQIAIRAYVQHIAVNIHTRAQYEHALDIRDRLYQVNNVVFVCVLVWWIACLWLDEPSASTPHITVEPDAGTITS